MKSFYIILAILFLTVPSVYAYGPTSDSATSGSDTQRAEGGEAEVTDDSAPSWTQSQAVLNQGTLNGTVVSVNAESRLVTILDSTDGTTRTVTLDSEADIDSIEEGDRVLFSLDPEDNSRATSVAPASTQP